MHNQQDNSFPYFMRLKQILRQIPVSRSTWLSGVKAGEFPKPIKLTKRTTAWLGTDICTLCDRLAGEPTERILKDENAKT